MRTMVEFDVGGTGYCLPVDEARAVRSTAGMVSLPDPGPHVAGLLSGDPPLTVVAPFGPDGELIIVLEVEDLVYGLLVHTVPGLLRIDETAIRKAPRGQQREILSGSITVEGHLLLVADPTAMAAGL
jgi:chemotaxis signal transduction protein